MVGTASLLTVKKKVTIVTTAIKYDGQNNTEQ